jgi:hypothetical protein
MFAHGSIHTCIYTCMHTLTYIRIYTHIDRLMGHWPHALQWYRQASSYMEIFHGLYNRKYVCVHVWIHMCCQASSYIKKLMVYTTAKCFFCGQCVCMCQCAFENCVFVCVCVYIYIYIYTYTYIWYTYIDIPSLAVTIRLLRACAKPDHTSKTYIHTQFIQNTYKYIHNTYIHTYIQTDRPIWLSNFSCRQEPIHACIHTYIHTYIHKYRSLSLLGFSAQAQESQCLIRPRLCRY